MIRLRELIPFSGNAEGTFEMEYRPLVVTQHPKEHLLTIMTRELGTFKYKISVTATPPTLRQSLRFDVPLGSSQIENYVFRTFNATAIQYACAVKRSDFFTVQKSLAAEAVKDWEGVDMKLPVAFEPTEIGEIKDTLTVSSPEGGEYLCDLVGVCSAPLPQGPFNFSEGATVEIPFRNCFSATCKWSFSLDSTHFRLPTPSASVAAKTKGTCLVVFEPDETALAIGVASMIAAKLFIRCDSKPDLPPWVFYLKGKLEPRKPVDMTSAESTLHSPPLTKRGS